MSEIKKQWYVIRAVGGKENKVKEYIESEIRHNHLEDYISQILIPTEKVYTIRNGKKISKEKVSYPGYVLIEAAFVGQIPIIIRNTPNVLGFLGDVVQLAITGTTGLGTLAGNLANSRYNRAASERAYADSRADTAWEQQMKELQRQDSLTQQQYKNELAEREYQDTLRQQQFRNDLASEKLDIAKGEWALKQSKAAQSARQASTNASAKAESGLSGSGLTAGKSGVSSGTLVPYSAARLRSQGRSDSAIRNELLKEGYSSKEVKSIMKQLNS